MEKLPFHSEVDSPESVPKKEKVEGVERLKQALRAGVVVLLSGCTAVEDMPADLYAGLNRTIITAQDKADRFVERLTLNNPSIIKILDTFDSGVKGDALTIIEDDLKELALEGENEFIFSIYKNEYGVWRLTALNQGDESGVDKESGLELWVPTYTGAKEVITFHNHPIVSAINLGYGETGEESGKEIAGAQLNMMRKGTIEPFPMPPSWVDLVVCAKTSDLFAERNIQYSCAVASSDVIWHVNVPAGAGAMVAQTFQERYKEYLSRHRDLFKHYSPEAIDGITRGDRSKYNEELEMKRGNLLELIEFAGEFGFRITSTPYHSSPEGKIAFSK
jgi:hypothetical protein